MLLFVDETENDDYFIVTGLLVNSPADIISTYNHFKKRANKLKISPKEKGKLFTEFKSTLLDNRYQKVKSFMIEELDAIERCVIYSCYVKKSLKFSQELKEATYIKLLSNIVEAIDTDIDIVFDTFNKKDFEDTIISSILEHENVNSIESCDSQLNPGLQYVDNLCSIYRHYLSGTDKNDFFDKIRHYVKII